MSNFYISNCCKSPKIEHIFSNIYRCLKCNLDCKVTAMIDEPNGVPREEPDQLLDEQDEENKRMYDLGFTAGVEKEKTRILSQIKGLGCEKYVDLNTLALIINKLR